MLGLLLINVLSNHRSSRHKVAQNSCRWQNSISNYGIRQFKNYLSRGNIMNPQTNNYAISKSNRDFDDAADKNKVIPGFLRLYKNR